MLEISNLCHCVQHPEKLTSWGFWSSRNESKPFCKQKCVLRKCWSRFICQVLCSGMQVISALVLGGSISQSRFICQVLCSGMQVISTLIPGGSLDKEGLSAKFGLAVFKVSLLDCPPLCSVLLENLLVGISGALGTKESQFLSKNVFWENGVGYLRNGEC